MGELRNEKAPRRGGHPDGPREAPSERDREFIPILHGMHPDPSVCRAGDEYILVTSTFEYSPGIAVHRSRDLVHWAHIGNVLTRDAQVPSGRARPGRGAWAPTIRYRDGLFHVVVAVADDPLGGQLLFRAADPAGPWDDGVRFPALVGIDPDLAWDEDGRCLLTYCAWDGVRSGIRQAVVDLERGCVVEGPSWIWHGTGLSHPEAPHLYRRGDWWHLVIAEGGTFRGHAVSAARAHSPHGPFVAHPRTPLLTRSGLRHEVQGVGHADLVERADGSWAAVHLGSRIRGEAPGWCANGRETFLAEVTWEADWPVLHPGGGLAPPHAQGFEERFDGAGAGGELHPRWLTPGSRAAVRATPSGVRLTAGSGPGAGGGGALLVRPPGLVWEACFEVAPGEGGGEGASGVVGVRIDDRHWFGARLGGGRARGTAVLGSLEAVTGETGFADGSVRIVLRAIPADGSAPDAHGPDVLQVEVEGRLVGEVDGRCLSTEFAGGFTGRLLGAWAEEGALVVRSAVLHGAD